MTNSRLGDIVDDNARSQRIADALSSGGMRTSSAATPPLPQPTTGSSYEGRLGALESLLSNRGQTEETGQVQPQQSPDLGVAPGIPNTLRRRNLSNLLASVNLDIANDREFYQRTGRMPTTQDKLLIESKRNFMLNHRRPPRPDELLYEAQRGLMQSGRGRRGIGPI